MSYLRQKSEFNITAAQYLIDENIDAPSIHCSYFSCFQLLKVVLKEFLKIDYNQQEKEIKDSYLNSHKYVIKKVLNEIRQDSELRYVDMRRIIYDLKTLREKADYRDIRIDNLTSLQAYNMAMEIRTYLTKKML